jgi:N-acyl-D-aspartate/D-glutamate deacylase
VTVFDLIVRGGTVVDGAGAPRSTRDVAIVDGRIVDVGDLQGRKARRILDADGLLVTPGFVDVHTHYDGQMTWDPLLAPSFFHGVTTIVAGNCGVGFAPVRPGKESWLCDLMEGVEDIPGTALAAGVRWGWETFGEYLDVVEQLPHAMDVGTQIPHGTVRAYVMGERGARNEAATPDDIEQMARLVEDALRAGALGFSTSRTVVHKAIDGENVPGTFAAADELLGLTSPIVKLGYGVVEWAPAGILGEDLVAPDRELALMRRISLEMGCPVTFGMSQIDAEPEQWRRLLALAADANRNGATVRPQVTCRPTAIHVGFRTVHPFMQHPTYLEVVKLPWPERIAKLRAPAIRERILSEQPVAKERMNAHRTYPPARMYRFTDPPDYEPTADQSIAAIAARTGQPPLAVLYDMMLERDGEQLVFYAIVNYHDGNGDATREMLTSPDTVLGLADGGAHVRVILDSGQTTYTMTHWARDRWRGPKIPLEWIIRKQTSDPARLFGLTDRGVVAPGMKADLNLIDFEGLRLNPPYVANDLPGGAERLLQDADGYVATVVSGEVVREGGRDTGARPGRLLRGPQRPAP